MANPIVELGKAGQSVWYDQMERALLTSGRLKGMIDEDDLRGLTSNPTIFEKAIGGSRDYDDALEALARKGADRDAIYEGLVLDDIGRAADVFAAVHDSTRGVDGFVSLEVSPLLAHDTVRTIDEAKRLFGLLGRRNVMIKVPATDEGIPAIEELIAAGLNVNVTLIFARAVYAKVMEAYLRGLERRAGRGEPIDAIGSVASFFVSRIDTRADAAIRRKIESAGDPAVRRELESLLGQVAIANARLAYQLFEKTFSGPRWDALRSRGARVQRPLWASTGTKDPSYSDVMYVESLIGPDTVNTIPPKTWEAFKDHGRVAPTLEKDLDRAGAVLENLEKLGISLDRITDELTVDGVRSFADSFESLMRTIESRREAVLRAVSGREVASLGKARARVDEALATLARQHIVERIWKKDPSVWKDEPAGREQISGALGWLDAPEWTLGKADEIASFAESVRTEFAHVVVLGMGGSSLCSEVLRNAFGPRSGWPRLLVLDSTIPAAVRALEKSIDPDRTLFIAASKSGTTTEPLVFQKYFWNRVSERKGERAGRNFIAITDAGTPLHDQAVREGWRAVFLNPPDIGGRYSALSLFGMVPAAVAGIDVRAFLGRAMGAREACSPSVPAEENPAAVLGATMGALAREGRDKVTVVASRSLGALGLWIEQLVAESTGKEGRGILPIALEPLEAPSAYGEDRIFVRIRMQDENDEAEATRLRELESAGHPVLERVLRDPLDLGDEMFVWELATAIAGHLLSINPFDQPNVQESKQNTRRLLDEFVSRGSLPGPTPLGAGEAIRLSGDPKWAAGGTPPEVLAALFATARPGRGYVALLGFFRETAERNRIVASIRSELMRALRVATTFGYGPRYLHSTGQLHKGGAGDGLFLQVTAEEGADVPIPGEPFGFSVLAAAQAQGDFDALASRGRRALRVDLDDVDRGLAALRDAIAQAVATSAGR
ncbi:MAG TPA: bifunctional transaldolase/phosoglucose isomerase [Thermoanaerobaculia bacterium]|nr:bifunctional transaldolase/phosoglucose isomerase [Thermoanaerobaculia bacterium]